jgi:hypothetical protein
MNFDRDNKKSNRHNKTVPESTLVGNVGSTVVN